MLSFTVWLTSFSMIVRASLLIVSVSLEPSSVTAEFSNWEVTNILPERAVYQRSLICKTLLSPFPSHFQCLGLWPSQNLLSLWGPAFHFLEFEELEESNGLRFEIAQWASSLPSGLVVAKDAVRGLSRPLLSSCAHLQALSAFPQSACTCYFLHSTALGLLEPMTNLCKNKKEQCPCLKLDKLWGVIYSPSAYWDQTEPGTLPAVIPYMASSSSMGCFSSSLPVFPRSAFLMNYLHMNPHLRICF